MDFALLLHFVSDWHLGKPTIDRSTVPLLNYWKNGEVRIKQLLGRLGGDFNENSDLCFEYAVRSANTISKPSFTDLAYLSCTTAVFIEAKWLEPLYRSVGKWKKDGRDSTNKEQVLNHWISLVEQRCRVVGDVDAVDYQMLHRLASACAAASDRAYLVYQIFHMEKDGGVHKQALQQLVQVCVPGTTLEVWWHSIAIQPTARHKELTQRFFTEREENRRAMAVRSALIRGDLFDFGKEELERVG